MVKIKNQKALALLTYKNLLIIYEGYPGPDYLYPSDFDLFLLHISGT